MSKRKESPDNIREIFISAKEMNDKKIKIYNDALDGDLKTCKELIELVPEKDSIKLREHLAASGDLKSQSFLASYYRKRIMCGDKSYECYVKAMHHYSQLLGPVLSLY